MAARKKKAAAKKTTGGDLIISKSRTKAAVKKCNVGSEFYGALAFTLRHYLSEQFGFPAYAMTRRELQRHTSRAGIDRWPARLTANLLEQCDAVQFAGFRPAPERVEADLTAAYEIIELTSGDEAAPATGTITQPGG